MDASDLKARYRRWLLELWHGDLGLAADLVTDDFLIHQARSRPGESEERRGPDGLREMVQMGHAPFEGLRFAIEVGPLVEGDLVAARWVGSGRYAGGIPGAEARRGTEVAFGGTDLLRAAPDGRFAEYWVSSDGLWLMQQLRAL
jgi:predicted ester cyclase